MKTAVVSALLAASLVAGASSLTSVASGKAQASDPQVTALKKRVTKLEKDVKALQKTQKTLVIAAVGNFAGTACTNAAVADALQQTWAVIDQVAKETQGGKVYFGPQSALNDQKSCPDLSVVRQSVPATSTPSVATLKQLIDFFYAP
jgi:uncharacterized iron-regulated protein